MSHSIFYFSLILLVSYVGQIKPMEKEQDFKSRHATEISFLRRRVVKHLDFPSPGILFQDFWPIISSPDSLYVCEDLLRKWTEGSNAEAVVGLESRGFVIGAFLARALNVGFVPVRKPGKLPGDVLSVSYEKEYGSDTFEIAKNAGLAGKRVIIVDDLIATGGTAKAAIELVKGVGGNPIEFITLLQVRELAERAELGVPRFNLID